MSVVKKEKLLHLTAFNFWCSKTILYSRRGRIWIF